MFGFHDKKIGYGANLGEGHTGVESGKLPMPGRLEADLPWSARTGRFSGE
jgi:hypothetical protein